MNLQYIKNTEPPPAQSVLQYSISPDTVYVSTNTQQMYANLTISVFNPQSDSVTCQMFRFGFNVGAAYGDLTTSVTGIETSSDQDNWTIAKQATVNPDQPTFYYYSAPASGMANQQLAPQQTLVFHLNGILINEAVGEGGVPIAITEVTGTQDNPSVVQGEITITKTEPTLSAQLAVVPATPVPAGAPVTLNWQVTDSDHWRLYDYDTDTMLYDSKTSSPPDADSYGPIYPKQNTNYELIAFHGQLFTISYAEAMVMAAHFLAQPTATPSVIDPGQQSVLSWKTKYASQLTISGMNFQPVVLNAPEGQYDYFPGAPNNQWIVSPTETTNFSLAITGPGQSSDERYVPVSVNVPQPIINSFTATPIVYTAGQSVALEWQTLNAFGAELSQKVLATQQTTSLGSVPVNKTGYSVTPPGGIVTYILTLMGEGETLGYATVAESVGTFSPITYPSSIAFDGTNLWVSDTNQSLYKVSPGDGTVLGQYGVGTSPVSIVFDGANIWTANNDGNNVTKVRVSDGKVIGTYPAQANPYGIAFDGENIWVTNGSSSSVTKLRASDGKVLGNYPVGNSPIGVAFDGENIWVANSYNKVTKLLANDGSLLGTYTVGAWPWGVLFDGTNIWVTNIWDYTVSKLRPGDGTVLGTFPTGPGPSALLYYAGNIWVTNTASGTISILDALTGASRGTIQVGGSPTSLAFDGAYFWVVSAGDDGTLMKL